jgi:hypothetical protein
MIRCSKCGTINKDDASFCIQCNAYLEWSGERIEDEVEVGPAQTPALDVEEPVEPAEPPRAGGAAESTSTPPPAAVGDARAQPSSRKPERTTATTAPKRKVVASSKPEKPKPGDRICPACGTGNDPKRKFCRRCGQDLVAAPVVAEPERRPWYRRLFRRGSGPVVYEAGARPEHLGRRRWRPGCLTSVVLLLLVVILGGAAVYALSRDARSAVNDFARSIECRVMEPIAGLTEPSLSFPARETPQFAAFDASDETIYLERERNAAGRFILTARFDRPYFLHRVEVTPAKEGDGGFPQRVVVAVDDVQVAETVMSKGQPAIIEVCRAGAQKLGIRVASTYDDAPDVAIARIAFRVRQ